jgi:hypothetical protein
VVLISSRGVVLRLELCGRRGGSVLVREMPGVASLEMENVSTEVVADNEAVENSDPSWLSKVEDSCDSDGNEVSGVLVKDT